MPPAKTAPPSPTQLSSADPNLYEGNPDETVTWLSRSDWNGTLPTETGKLALTELLKERT